MERDSEMVGEARLVLEVESYAERQYHQNFNLGEQVKYTLESVLHYIPTYLLSFLPILSWIKKYNRYWLIRDVLAGVTLSFILIPEALAYAKLARVPVEFGLYSSFVGTMVYAFLGTTREIAVGPASVLAMLAGEVIVKVRSENPQFSAQEIGSSLSFYAALVALTLGITRLASLLDLIPEPVIVGFTSGAALTIILSQIPGLLGVPDVAKEGPTYQQIYDLFANLIHLNWVDLVFGLASLIFICTLKFGTVPYLNKHKWLFYFKVGANGIAVILFTVISYLVSTQQNQFKLKLVGAVPSGIKDVGVPNLDPKLLSSISTQLIPVVLVMVLEHVSISRLFARKGKYQISASQELFAIGVCNLSASFLSAFPTTGSFTRSAVNYTSAIVTPLSGMVVGSIVIFSIYFLTPLFYYIPNSTLSSVVVAAASTLIVDYRTVKELFSIQFFEGIILLVAGVLTFFVSAEVGILTAVGFSFLLMIYRIARPHVYLLQQVVGRTDAFIDHKHPRFETIQPIPGVLIFRPQESLTFPNIDYIKNRIIDTTIELTDPGQRAKDTNKYLWTDDLITRSLKIRQHHNKIHGNRSTEEIKTPIPRLRGVILDFSAVNTLDASGIEGLLEIRELLTEYAGHLILKDNENLNPTEDQHRTTLFELHFVSVHPSVVNLLDQAELTKPLSTFIDLELFHTLTTLTPNPPNNANTLSRQLSPILSSHSINLPSRINRHFPDSHPTFQLRPRSKHPNYLTTIDPIAFKPTRFVHLTLNDAVRRLRKRIDTLDSDFNHLFETDPDDEGVFTATV